MKIVNPTSLNAKAILLLFAVFASSSLFAKDLTVQVLEGWKSKPLPNCQIVIKSNVGKVLQEVKTDSLGKVMFPDLTYGYHTVETNYEGEDYENETIRFKLQGDTEITLILKPTRAYQRLQLTLEDEKYGKLEGKKNIEQKEKSDTTERSSTTDSEWIEAVFPGGTMGMKNFIKRNIIYPEICRDLNEQGRVYVVFIIEPDGVITHVGIRRGVSPDLDDEAKRVIRAMPKWTPAKVDDKNVRTKCILPITFTLN